MIGTTWKLASFCLLVTLTQTLSAQDPAVGRRGGRGGGGIPDTNALIGAAADADRSGDITAEEWQAFLVRVNPDGSSEIDRRILKAWLLAPGLDRNGDGNLTGEDLNLLFAALDTDGDGALQSSEVSGAGRRSGRGRGGGQRGGRAASSRLVQDVVLQSADGDGNGEVTSGEWAALLVSADPNGTGDVAIIALAAWIQKAEAAVPEDRTALTAGVILMTVDANLDRDRNGVLTVSDLNQAFGALDRNGDGQLGSDELRPQVAQRGGRGARGGGRRGRGGGTPTEQDKQKPPLMPFQRNLEDALVLVESTGKPLLICVNMDGEPASEQLAWLRYRDPAFVELVSGFIPIVVSPDRRNPRDHDDRGRRIPDARFGRVVNAEHIDIEPELFERYFQGQRVAPRHLAVDKDGNILFDIYLVNDLRVVDEALREHGVRDGKIPRAETLDEQALLASPDAGHRAFLEQLFTRGNESTRLRLAGEALSSRRRTQHPEILQMALMDPETSVRLRALANMADNSEQAPLELYPSAFRAGGGSPASTSLLLDALQKTAGALEDEARKSRARRMGRVFSGLSLRSGLLDLGSWRAALRSGARVAEVPLAEDQLEELGEQLDELESRYQEDPGNAELSAQIAGLTMRYARIQILTSQDPTFVLEDVRAAAQRATSPRAPHGRALGLLAWASYLLGDPEATIGAATRALPNLVDEASTPLAAEVLSAFALSRTQGLYDAMGAGSEWPSSWVSDIQAAYEILLDHPDCTEAQALAYANWLTAMEAYAQEASAVERGLALFPLSPELHQVWRELLLRDGGARVLERGYASLSPRPENLPTVTWFSGLASIVAAERRVQDGQPEEAIAAYSRSIDKFRAAVDLNPTFRSSSVHYISLGLAGRSRLRMEAGQLDRSLEDMRNAIAENPATATWEDGLGNSPGETANALYRALSDSDRDQDARALKDLLAQHGVQIGISGGGLER